MNLKLYRVVIETELHEVCIVKLIQCHFMKFKSEKVPDDLYQYVSRLDLAFLSVIIFCRSSSCR